jgi:putative membrane protein
MAFLFTKMKVLNYSFSKLQGAIFLLSVLYFVGFLGVSIPLHEDFMLLTPFNLFFTFFISVWAAPQLDYRFWISLLIIYFSGFFIEVTGVQSRILFGAYDYGKTLGIKVFDTPLIIGINWAMLVIGTSSFANFLFTKFSIVFRTVVAALIMVSNDFIIEPVAVYYDFWTWETEGIGTSFFVAPLQNYIAWYVLGFLLIYFFNTYNDVKRYLALEFLLLLQAVFFIWIYYFIM